MSSLLVTNARQFNDGSENRLKNGGDAGSRAGVYGKVFRRRAATGGQPRQQIVAFAHYRAVRLAFKVRRTGSFMDLTGGSMANKIMRADNVLTALAAVAAAATFATVTFATTTPSKAETAVHVRHHHAPARVTVRKRSYLDPGTEAKRNTEHYTDYYRSVTHGYDPMRNSTLFQNGPSLPFFHDRMPFPNCLDLAGFCN
jgi:hypothetical protein